MRTGPSEEDAHKVTNRKETSHMENPTEKK